MIKTKNTPKWAEDHFENAFKKKKASVHRFIDYKDVNFGINSDKPNVAVPEAPADFLVTFSKQTFYVDVKSIEKSKAFSFSGIRPAQWKAAIRTVQNGGKYFFVLYFKNLNQWFWLPARVVIDSDKRSITLDELQPYQVTDTFN